MSELLDYTAEELTGQSMYALCHGEDVHKLKNTHEDCKFQKNTPKSSKFIKKKSQISIFFSVLNKGQVMSNYYRILNKSGGYSWVQSCATLICNTKNADEQSIICVNYVLSGPQFADIVMDTCQTDSKLGIAIKDDCRCDFIEAGEKCEVHGKKSSKKLNSSFNQFESSGSLVGFGGWVGPGSPGSFRGVPEVREVQGSPGSSGGLGGLSKCFGKSDVTLLKQVKMRSTQKETKYICIKQSSNVFSLEFNHFQVLEVMEFRGFRRVFKVREVCEFLEVRSVDPGGLSKFCRFLIKS